MSAGIARPRPAEVFGEPARYCVVAAELTIFLSRSQRAAARDFQPRNVSRQTQMSGIFAAACRALVLNLLWLE